MAETTTITNGQASPKITLYTNHLCPWAHRAHIALHELNLPFEEIIIDLSKPREQWYLDINPRGLVPTLQYSNGLINNTILESGIIAQFLADSHPAQLLPASHSSPFSALFRARVNFFVDTYISKINPLWYSTIQADIGEEKDSKCEMLVKTIEKEIEPLLEDAAPFFGRSDKITLAEVQTASFVLRLYSFADDILLPTSLLTSLSTLPNFSKWAKATLAEKSVLCIWDPEEHPKKMRARVAEMKAAKK
ncbi:MAG: hypothetical protein M1812_003239 [Candelaria pacifica]|nr:MAG: hypothetical protein M1812_003239 [Candelaria pacifica]